MSDLTPTNQESLEDIKRRAQKDGKKVTVIGQHVCVHPKGIKIPTSAAERKNVDKGKYGKYWVMWAMEW